MPCDGLHRRLSQVVSLRWSRTAAFLHGQRQVLLAAGNLSVPCSSRQFYPLWAEEQWQQAQPSQAHDAQLREPGAQEAVLQLQEAVRHLEHTDFVRSKTALPKPPGQVRQIL